MAYLFLFFLDCEEEKNKKKIKKSVSLRTGTWIGDLDGTLPEYDKIFVDLDGTLPGYDKIFVNFKFVFLKRFFFEVLL